jgi:hypothetical protein
MANRFPLIVDKDDQNKLKELPQGDSLDLQGSGIVNAASITTSELIVGGIEYNPFSGNYNDLTNKPTIAQSTTDLTEGDNLYFTTQRIADMIVAGTGIGLAYDSEAGTLTITSTGGGAGGGAVSLNGLTDVTTVNPSASQVLKFNSVTQQFNNAFVNWNEVQSKPTFAAVATSGSYTDLTDRPSLVVDIDDLADVDTVSTPPTTGQVLKWNGEQWAPANDITQGGEGLDADTLDGQDGSYYLNYNNLNNRPSLFSGDWNDLLNVPSTLDGFGITDAVNRLENVSLAGTLAVNGNSFLVGENQDFGITATPSGLSINSNVANKNVALTVRDSNGVNTAITIEATSSHVGIFNTDPQHTLDVGGNINASTVIASTLQGNGANITGITFDQVLTGGSSTTQGFSAGTITPSEDSTYNLGTNTIRYSNVYADTLHGDGSNITNLTFSYDNLTDKPTSFTGLTSLSLASGATLNEFSTDGTLAGNSDTAAPTEAAVKTYVDTAIASFSSVGNFTLSASNIDTDDSSAISITPAVTMQSDLTVENDLTVNNDVTINGRLNISTFSSTATGTPTLASDSVIVLDAQDEVRTTAPFRLVNLTSAERDNLTPSNGHVIYNTTTNKAQVYANGTWVDLH